MALNEHTIDDMTKAAVDSGKIVEAGWLGLRSMIFPDGAPEDQIREMRMAFFAGAQHLYASIMRLLEPGDDPTTADLGRLQLIDAELRAFIEDFQIRHVKTDGSA